jgi:uncharacterized protein
LLEADGSVYPCDFYVEHPYLLGNILKDSYAAIEASGAGLSFMESSWKLPQQCSQCRWLNLCRGGCKRYRDEQGLFIHCAAYRQFFRTCMAELAQMQLC